MTHHVYIMTNRRRSALFCGIAEDLEKRVRDHRARRTGDIAPKRHLTHLLWSEPHEDQADAETRQAEIRKLSRKKKEAMLEAVNPEWRCLMARDRVDAGRGLKQFDWRKYRTGAVDRAQVIDTPFGPVPAG